MQKRCSLTRSRSFRFFFFLGGLFLLTHASNAQPPASRPSARKTAQKPSAYDKIEQREKAYKHIQDVMQSELKRYMAFFARRPIPKVYSLRYRLRLTHRVLMRASGGSISTVADNRNNPDCKLDVSMRVGNHKFDQTGRDGRDWNIRKTLLPASKSCPSKFNDDVLKKQLWQLTDRDYRVAFAQYWRKRYVRSIKPKILDKAGDFSKEPPTIYQAPLSPKLTLDKKKWKGILKRITARGLSNRRVMYVSFMLNASDEVTLGVGNKGSRVRLRERGYDWALTLQYIGKNKEYVNGSRNGFARTEKGLPTEAQLEKTYDELLSTLQRKVQAEEGDPDEGPAIVDPMLAGALFYDILMARLSTGRFLRPNDQRLFAKKLGKQIIPSFLSVFDDPTLKSWKGTPLNSHYLYDDEWVPARRLTMVKDGVLKNFYMSRKPYKKHQRSNGHGRAAFGVQPFSRPGTTIIESKKTHPLPTLRQMLIAKAKQQKQRYAYILRRFEGYSKVSSSIYTVKPEEIIQIDVKTGKEKALKGLRVRTNALQLIRGIQATGDDRQVFNGSDSEDSGNINIAVVAPSLLLDRVVFSRYRLQEKKDYELPPPSVIKTPASRKAPTRRAPTSRPTSR